MAMHYSHLPSEHPRIGIVSRLKTHQRHYSHSLAKEPRKGIVSRLKIQQGTTALTDWRAKDKHCQQARNKAKHHSHSLAREPRTGMSTG